MKTNLKRFIAGAGISILASAFSACSPGVVAVSRPRPVLYTPAPVPVQTVEVTPVVPVWAPPYSYITEVHYYYFPDYMMYYDVFAQHYCYYDGFNWLHVTVLPSMPVFYGFNPYNAYIVVLNHSAYQPWVRNDFYTQQYPSGYYKTMYAPRTALGSNTVLRAYDENQSKPLFVDKRSNKEVAVKYDVRPSRNSGSNDPIKNSHSTPQSTGRTNAPVHQEEMTVRTDRTEKIKPLPDHQAATSMQQHSEMNSPAHGTIKNNDSREVNANATVKNQSYNHRDEIRNNQPVNHGANSNLIKKNNDSIKNSGPSGRGNSIGTTDAQSQKKDKQNRGR